MDTGSAKEVRIGSSMNYTICSKDTMDCVVVDLLILGIPGIENLFSAGIIHSKQDLK